MHAVRLWVPPGMLEERRRLGIDGRDEMWDGVVHVVPPAGDAPQALQPELLYALFPLARRAGLLQRVETGLYGDERDYRVPDQLCCRPEHRSERGAEGAELVIEIRSAGDETYDKIDWYADRGVREMLIVHPETRRVELLRNVGGRLLPVSAGPPARCTPASSASPSPRSTGGSGSPGTAVALRSDAAGRPTARAPGRPPRRCRGSPPPGPGRCA